MNGFRNTTFHDCLPSGVLCAFGVVLPKCVCVFSPMDVKFVGNTSRGHTGFLIHLPSAVLALIFLARKIQPFLSLVNREVEFMCTNDLIVLHLLGISIFISIFSVRKNPSYRDSNSRPNVSEGYEVTNELPGKKIKNGKKNKKKKHLTVVDPDTFVHAQL